MGSRHPSIVPYECFPASDGFVNIAVTNLKQWTNFCSVLGFSQLATDPRFETMSARLANYELLKPIMYRAVSALTRAEVIRKMSEAGIPAGPVNTVGEIMEDPQVDAREMVVRLTHPEYGPLRVLGIPIKLSDTPGSVDTAPPRFGEHNNEILASLGYDANMVAAFLRSGAIAESS
jgi:crotonobetainyl-CoA:carnitine CoA-transferase CaiB-like acyl-CoA transferase